MILWFNLRKPWEFADLHSPSHKLSKLKRSFNMAWANSRSLVDGFRARTICCSISTTFLRTVPWHTACAFGEFFFWFCGVVGRGESTEVLWLSRSFWSWSSSQLGRDLKPLVGVRDFNLFGVAPLWGGKDLCAPPQARGGKDSMNRGIYSCYLDIPSSLSQCFFDSCLPSLPSSKSDRDDPLIATCFCRACVC